MIRVNANLTRYLSALADTRTDGELLAAFLATRDEPAFAELVHRHGPLVWSACRRLLPDSADVEDAFQATFLVLVRRAHRLTGRATLGPWLYQVAAWTARNIRRRNARALARRVPLPATTPDPSPGPTAADLRADLDAALLALPERYRAPLVLCHLQGWSRRDAAARLGYGEGTLSSLLSRGLARLRDRLGSHDPTRALALPGSVVPAVLAATTVQAAVAARVVTAGVISSTASQLAEGVLHMFWVKKVTAASFALAVVFGLGVGAGVSVREVPGATAADGPTGIASPPAKSAETIAELEARLAKLRNELMVATIANTNAEVEIALAKAKFVDAQSTGDPRSVYDPLQGTVRVAEANRVVLSQKIPLLKVQIRDLEAKLLAAKAAKPIMTPPTIAPAPQTSYEMQYRLRKLRDELKEANTAEERATDGFSSSILKLARSRQKEISENETQDRATIRRFEEQVLEARKKVALLQEAITAVDAQLKATEPPSSTPANLDKEAFKSQILRLQLQITKLKEDHARFEKMSQDVAAARDETARQLAELNKQLDEIARKPQPGTPESAPQSATPRQTPTTESRVPHLELTIGTKDAKWPFQVREIGADGKSAGAIGFENVAVLGRYLGLAAKGPSAPSVVQIRVQSDVPYALLITTIETCKAAGIKGFRLELEWASDLGQDRGLSVPMATSDPRATEQQELKRRIESFRKLMEEHGQKPKDTTPPPL